MKNTTKKIFFFVSILILIFVYFLGIRGLIEFPQFLNIFGFEIYLYSLSILSGITLVAYLFDREKSKYKELRKLDTLNALSIIMLLGIIGARLWHVATDFYLYKDDLYGVFEVWRGGLGIYGAIIGGIFGIILYTKKNKIKILHTISLLSVFFPLGQIIGRLGNFFNQELYGYATSIPWGFYVREKDAYFHPSFLYEQLGMTVLFVLLFYMYKKFQLRGEYVLVYLSGYAFTRFCVDFFRTEPDIFVGLTVAQVVSLGIILTSFLIYKFKLMEFQKWKK